MNKKALITGVYGQDGSYLAEYLYSKGYEVYGVSRQQMSPQSEYNKEILNSAGIDVFETYVDIYDGKETEECIADIMPDEIYHLAAFHSSSVKAKDELEIVLVEKNISSTLNLLNACYRVCPNSRIVTAGSCLMFDASNTIRQNEKTAFESDSFYGIAKITENMLVKKYRESGLFACTAILYNHESSRRAADFVTKKIVENMIRIKKGIIDRFSLGSLDTMKDWGFAGDYIRGMNLMLEQDFPEDFILSSGELHSIRDFCAECAKQLEIDGWEKRIDINEAIIARKVKGTLYGDCTKAEKKLKWTKYYSFEDIVSEMIQNTKIQ